MADEEVDAAAQLQEMKRKLEAQEAKLNVYESNQAKAMASGVATKEALREGEKKVELAKFTAPGMKRNYELLMDLQFKLEDLGEGWSDVLTDGIGEENDPNIVALLTPDKIPTVAKAILSTATIAGEMLERVKHEQRMIEAAAAATTGWKAVKYMEQGSGKFREGDEEWTERMRVADSKAKKEGEKGKKKPGWNNLFKKRGSYLGRGGRLSNQDNFVRNSGGYIGGGVSYGGPSTAHYGNPGYQGNSVQRGRGAFFSGRGKGPTSRNCWVCGGTDHQAKFCSQKKSG